MRILVTGATGNVGTAVVERLRGSEHELHAGARHVERARDVLGDGVTVHALDFERGVQPDDAFDAVFLLRPPALADPDVFERFLKALSPSASGAPPKIVFLSVQGAGERPWLPHAKIEKRIRTLGMPHAFVRPSYFMENLLTTLRADIERHHGVRLPARRLRLNWVAVRDVAAVAAAALTSDVPGTSSASSAPGSSDASGADDDRPSDALDAANTSRAGFAEVIDTINRIAGTDLVFESPSLPAYLVGAAKERQGFGRTGLMLMLHWLPQFGSQDGPIRSDVRRVTGREPTSIEDFVRAHRDEFARLAAHCRSSGTG